MVAEFVPEVTPEMVHKKRHQGESEEVIQILAVSKVIQMNNFLCVCLMWLAVYKRADKTYTFVI